MELTNSGADASEELLGKAAGEFFEALANGGQPSVDDFAQRYPSVAEHIIRTFPALLVFNDASHSDAGDVGEPRSCAGRLGDFEIIRELGRGGMGVVYEAEQISLGRRVALKVLPFAAMLAKQQLARFKNEARAAATLDHPNIVAVHAVGADRGVHYYAMQLIEGQSLAEVIATLKQNRTMVELPSAQFNRWRADDTENAALTTELHKGTAFSNSAPAVPATTLPAYSSREYFRAIAALGVQACNALDHAHEAGILHRDIKPANLLVDDDGKLWITDFGLARVEQDAGLTMTGDLLGTLRYMSPEQALAKQVVVDHRSDIYSLGATLYELLTLTAVFPGDDRQELLKHIAFDEPSNPRHINPSIPLDLETIVLKSIEKSPTDRYLTARQFADDLSRFLSTKPILARRSTLLQHVSKWSRRHVGIVWTIVAACFATMVVLGTSLLLIRMSRDEAENHRAIAVAETAKASQQREIALVERNNARLSQYYAEMVVGQSDWEQGNVSGLRAKLNQHLPLLGETDRRGWEWFYLASHAHPESRTLHDDFARSYVAASADGNYVGSAGRIWNIKSGERIRNFFPSNAGTVRGGWNPARTEYAWTHTSSDCAFYIWDRASDKVERVVGHEESVWCVNWSPSGSLIATGSGDHTVKIWDATTKAELREFKVQGNVTNVAWSSDSKLVAAGLESPGETKVWSVESGELVAEYRVDGSNFISWRPDGQTLAIAVENVWKLIDCSTWQVKSLHTLPHKAQALQFSPTGKLLAIANGESVSLFDQETAELVRVLHGHKTKVIAVCWAGDDGHLISSSGDGEIKLWDVGARLPKLSTSFELPISSISWRSDSAAVVARSVDQKVEVSWNPDADSHEKKSLAVEKPNCVSSSNLLAAKLQADKRSISILDAASGETRSTIVLPSRKLRDCAFSPDDTKLCTVTLADLSMWLDIWDIRRESLISSWEIKIENGAVLRKPVWSPDSSAVAIVGRGDVEANSSEYWEECVHIIDCRSGKRMVKHRPRGDLQVLISALDWSSDGKAIAIGTPEGRLEIVQVQPYQVVSNAKVHQSKITSLAWQPNEERVAVATEEGDITLIATNAGQPLLKFTLDDQLPTVVAWSPNGKRLAAVASSGKAQIWDATGGYEFGAQGGRNAELAWEYWDRARSATGDRALQSFQRALEIAPDTLDFWFVRGNASALVGNFLQAEREFAKILESNPQHCYAAEFRALCLLELGDMPGYRAACVALAPLITNAPKRESTKYFAARVCVLAPNPDLDRKAILIALNATGNPTDQGDPERLLYSGFLYREGQHQQAHAVLQSVADAAAKRSGTEAQYLTIVTNYFLALTNAELGDREAAARCLQIADKHVAGYLAQSSDWFAKTEVSALGREAKAVLGSSSRP